MADILLVILILAIGMACIFVLSWAFAAVLGLSLFKGFLLFLIVRVTAGRWLK